jgi:hypothetical protein
MDRTKPEMSYREMLKKSSVAILLGSLITTWLFIALNYFETIDKQGYYSAPLSMLELHLMCIPIIGYQFPSYLISNLICVNFFKRGWLKSAILTCVAGGVFGWILSTLLLYTLSIDYTLENLLNVLQLGLPSLIVYYVFVLAPRKRVDDTI